MGSYIPFTNIDNKDQFKVHTIPKAGIPSLKPLPTPHRFLAGNTDEILPGTAPLSLSHGPAIGHAARTLGFGGVGLVFCSHRALREGETPCQTVPGRPDTACPCHIHRAQGPCWPGRHPSPSLNLVPDSRFQAGERPPHQDSLLEPATTSHLAFLLLLLLVSIHPPNGGRTCFSLPVQVSCKRPLPQHDSVCFHYYLPFLLVATVSMHSEHSHRAVTRIDQFSTHSNTAKCVIPTLLPHRRYLCRGSGRPAKRRCSQPGALPSCPACYFTFSVTLVAMYNSCLDFSACPSVCALRI